ncbi:MAG: hypothetical protein U0235_07050 [Polyangiaceae bacterium]
MMTFSTLVSALGLVAFLAASACSSSATNTATPADAAVEVRDAAPDADPRLTSPIPFPSENGACPPGAHFVWTSAGCGAAAPTPMCKGPISYGCLESACGCDGKVVQACKGFPAPYSPAGLPERTVSPFDGGPGDLAIYRPGDPCDPNRPRDGGTD